MAATKREDWLKLRMTAAEKRKAERLAEAEGLSVSAYVRRMLLLAYAVRFGKARTK